LGFDGGYPKGLLTQSDLVKLQGDFHFSFGTSTKRSEQPQGDFFTLQREPWDIVHTMMNNINNSQINYPIVIVFILCRLIFPFAKTGAQTTI
jgi:hypothetical protein